MGEKETINKFNALQPIYVAYTERVKALIDELLKLENIKTQLIEGRTKTVDSLKEKIRRPGKSYKEPLKEITDLSGIRVIVYYHDDVDKVAKLLSKEFTIIETESSHQPNQYSPDQFGYISLHYIVKVKQGRATLPEWKTYKDFVSEIQIRTVLQHSWAAVSHALQYKHESDVPKQLRRKLFRLAGLFELADEEFISVRDQTEKTRSNAAASLKQGNATIPIDSITLNEFIQQWGKLDETVKNMESVGFDFNPPYDEDYDELESLGEIAKHCEKVGINTIEELTQAIEFDSKSYFEAFKEYSEGWFVSNSFALILLLIRSKADQFTTDDLVEAGWSEDIASRVINIAIADSEKN